MSDISKSRNERPDPEEDFAGFIEHSIKDVVSEMEANPEPEYWLAKSAARLLKMKRINAPKSIIDHCEKTLRDRIARFTGSETQRIYTDPKEYWAAMAEWLKTQPRPGWDVGPHKDDPKPL
jgi:hypothetical protein